MVQFEYPRVILPLIPFTVGVYYGVPFSLDAGKGNCCMWPVNQVEIYFAKIGFVDSKWSNLNAPGPYTPWGHSLFMSPAGCPFLGMQEKRSSAYGLFKKWNFTF